MTAQTTFVDIDNARLDDQREEMRKIIAADHCPFCAENLQKYHHEETLREGKYWFLTKNHWPYENTTVHLHLIVKEHVTTLTELAPEAGAELIELASWAIRTYSMPGGGLAMRFGDTNYSAATISHLHAHIIQPDISAPDYDQHPVRVKIGETKKKL